MSFGLCATLPEQISLDQVQNSAIYDLTNSFRGEDGNSPYGLDHVCPYVSCDDFYAKLTPSNLSFVSINVRAINNKWSEVCNFLNVKPRGVR